MGLNQGHISILLPIARDLLAAGHQVELAVRDLGALPDTLEDGIRLWQAPVWAGSLSKRSGSWQPPNSLNDVLALAGVGDTAVFRSMILGWSSLLSLIKPDAVICEYSPALATAARGVIPSVAVGTGFTTPPPTADTSVSLNGGHGWSDERVLVKSANLVLEELSRPRIESISDIFQASFCWLATLPSIDPYSSLRTVGTYVRPWLDAEMQLPIGSKGEEIFVYSHNQVQATNGWWKALKALHLPTRVHMRNPSPQHVQTFRDYGFAFETKPVSMKDIANRSRVIVSHGGHGLVCSILNIGIPHLISAYDSEKLWNGQVVENLGCGLVFDMITERAVDLAQRLYQLYHYSEFTTGSTNFAKSIRGLDMPSYATLFQHLAI